MTDLKNSSHCELVIGIVAPVGVNLDDVQNRLESFFNQFKYAFNFIQVSKLALPYLVAPYMDVSRKASFSNVKFQRGCSLIYGLLAQAFYPAGPDGIRGQSSHLQIELDALGDYRIVSAPV